MTDLEKCIHPFVPSYHKWARFVNPRTGFFSNDIPGVNFGTGFLVANQQEIMEVPHVHEATNEYFIFTGADLDNVFDAEFEIDFFMGDESDAMELFTITKPTIVCVPPYVWHCPIFYKKVVRGTNTMILYSGANWGKILRRVDEKGKEEFYYEGGSLRHCVKDPSKKCTFCGQCFSEGSAGRTEEGFMEVLAPLYKKAKPRSGKFDKYVYELRKDYHSLGDAVMNPRLYFGGVDEVENAEHQFSFNIVTKPVKLGDDEPVCNGQIAEFLWFSGCDVTREFECFDAEIEVWLGEDPDRMQKLVVDRPAVVSVAPGMWRGPINIKRVGKPLAFIPWYPHKKRYKLSRRLVDGGPLLVYDDETTIRKPTPGDELFMNIKNRY
jgi:hypothetical protein